MAEPILIEMTSTKNTIVTDGICPTLTARMGTGGNQVNAVLVAAGGKDVISEHNRSAHGELASGKL